MDEAERRNTAYHEAGHALLSILLEPDVEPLHKVSIIPRGVMLGATMFLPEKDRYNLYRRQLIGEVKVSFGGRIAEELFMGDISAGAANDIRQATQIARHMVCDWGMSERMGPIRYSANEDTAPWGAEMYGPKEHSDATAHKIDEEVQSIISTCYKEARELLDRNRDALMHVAEDLLKKEVLTADLVRKILEGLPLYKPPRSADPSA
jgi:cell division protease FtsH